MRTCYNHHRDSLTAFHSVANIKVAKIMWWQRYKDNAKLWNKNSSCMRKMFQIKFHLVRLCSFFATWNYVGRKLKCAGTFLLDGTNFEWSSNMKQHTFLCCSVFPFRNAVWLPWWVLFWSIWDDAYIESWNWINKKVITPLVESFLDYGNNLIKNFDGDLSESFVWHFFNSGWERE